MSQSGLGIESPFSIIDHAITTPLDASWDTSSEYRADDIDSSSLKLQKSMTTSSSDSCVDSPYSLTTQNSKADTTTLSPFHIRDTITSPEFGMIITETERLAIPQIWEETVESSIWPPLEGDINFGQTDDPFMGWGDRSAAQDSDEYGWVLSHVEHL